jgi:nucleotide-binding universal stress UspA family protein
MTLRHLLCPIDFSDVSLHALDQAGQLARHSGARLTILHVFLSVAPGVGPGTTHRPTPRLIDPADLERLQQRVAEAARQAVGPGVEVEAIAVGGTPAACIVDTAATGRADLIVMGTHGSGGFQHLMLGSVTERVLRRATCPVLTVPPRSEARAVDSFRHALCAVDFSDCSRAAVTAAAAMIEGPEARLTLVHVLEWPWHEPSTPAIEGVPPAQAQALLEYRRYLESSAADGLRGLAKSLAPGRRVVTAVRFGKPWRELLDAARDAQADLLVLGVRGRGAVDIAFFGSTTNQVVRRAPCPVLTVRE